MIGIDEKSLRSIAPSAFVRRFARRIVDHAGDRPILDVACGGCRNAVLLAHLGGNVIGIDIDLQSAERAFAEVQHSPFRECLARIALHKLDLLQDAWPFCEDSVGAIINVHFLHLPLLRRFSASLVPKGHLLVETIPAYGGNFHDLPQSGSLRRSLHKDFELIEYRERPTGPLELGRVAVKLVGIRHETLKAKRLGIPHLKGPDRRDVQ